MWNDEENDIQTKNKTISVRILFHMICILISISQFSGLVFGENPYVFIKSIFFRYHLKCSIFRFIFGCLANWIWFYNFILTKKHIFNTFLLPIFFISYFLNNFLFLHFLIVFSIWLFFFSFLSFHFLKRKTKILILCDIYKSDRWETVQCFVTAIITCVKRFLCQLQTRTALAAVVAAIMSSHRHHQAIIMNSPRR